MRIVVPSLEVGETDGFSNDFFNRKNLGESLSNLIVNSEDELVISLDGKWGEGKTTFVKMWQGMLREKRVPSLYIDAFANDMSEEAFMFLAGSIMDFASKNVEDSKKERITALLKKASKVGARLLSWSAKMGVKAATLGLIKGSDLEELKDLKEDFSDDLSNTVGEMVEKKLKSYAEEVESIQSFRALLEELPSSIKNENGAPLVIIVDELDRCKPNFAVSVIETIKHLFSVKNIVFVLVMNKEQLEEAIRCVYGQGINAHEYLQKFINIETHLPKKSESRHMSDYKRYCQHLLDLHGIETGGDDDSVVGYVAALASHFNFSLRQLERVFTNLAVYKMTKIEKRFQHIALVLFMAVVKVENPMVYKQLSQVNLSFDEAMEELGFKSYDSEDENRTNLLWLLNWVRYALISEEDFQALEMNDPIRAFGQNGWPLGLRRRALLPRVAAVLDAFIVS